MGAPPWAPCDAARDVVVVGGGGGDTRIVFLRCSISRACLRIVSLSSVRTAESSIFVLVLNAMAKLRFFWWLWWPPSELITNVAWQVDRQMLIAKKTRIEVAMLVIATGWSRILVFVIWVVADLWMSASDCAMGESTEFGLSCCSRFTLDEVPFHVRNQTLNFIDVHLVRLYSRNVPILRYYCTGT